ncbi:hypothetical protein CMI37_38600 [Candidatus Pacearchaeota archaeon]|nr:hypothetical protein [Candidatus Pacearchaeota archaeon]
MKIEMTTEIETEELVELLLTQHTPEVLMLMILDVSDGDNGKPLTQTGPAYSLRRTITKYIADNTPDEQDDEELVGRFG